MQGEAGRFVSLLAAVACMLPAAGSARCEPAGDPPPVPREFRAAWIATVANIDWPSRPGRTTARQKRELIALFDAAVDLNLNAIILQVRPSADALYASPLEPWSEYLTGRMGLAPEPEYDPLKFAIREAHRRGLQLHAWFNPYRVRHADAKTPASADHASLAHPEIVRQYGKYLWFDPGEPAAAERFLAVVRDIVTRYDVDGVHIDDYFYPYPVEENGRVVPFPDDASYARAVAAGESLDRDDWRRQNVDRLIERMYAAVKEAKPWVLVGVSPFGIWRPGHPEGVKGFDQYASLYADARKWLREGWVDYFTPQLYWRIDSPGQSYPKLLAWWQEQNTHGRHLWPGNFTSRVRRGPDVEISDAVWPAEELIHQIETTRAQPGAGGNVHFSMKALVDHRDELREKLKSGPYSQPALVPESPWLGEETHGRPVAEVDRDANGLRVRMKSSDGAPWLWVVRVRQDNQWQTAIVPGVQAEYRLPIGEGSAADEVAVSAVTRLGREGPLARAEVGESR